MDKIGNKGFMMAEVVIVSTVILVTLVSLYTLFNKMYIVYSERSYYYNVDAVYALRTIYSNLVDNENMVSLVNNGLQENQTTKKDYVEIIHHEKNQCDYVDQTICDGLIDTYGVSRVLLVRYNESAFQNLLVDSSYDRIIEDYFDYLNDSLDFDEDFSYIFIIELVDGDYQYYGNYRVR